MASVAPSTTLGATKQDSERTSVSLPTRSWSRLIVSYHEPDAAFPVLEIQQRKFTGGLHWDGNGTLVRNHLPEGQEWVGPPSPELDALWERVIDGIIP